MAGVFDNPVFPYFAFYATVVILKTLLMSLLTAVQRFSNKAFVNPEDVKGMKKGDKYLEPTSSDKVERVRRCHLNDLENVIPFVLIGFLYTATGPSLGTALLHFRIFTGARILHTIAYLLPLPQPSRALAFAVGLIVTVSMAVSILSTGKM